MFGDPRSKGDEQPAIGAEQIERISTEIGRIVPNLRTITSTPTSGLLLAHDARRSFVSRARAMLAGYDERAKTFSKLTLVGDPSWAMLLDLYVATIEQRNISVSSLTIASRGPRTTALRHITVLIQQGIIVREDDRMDRRRAWVRLTAKGKAQMELWFERTC